MGQAQTDKPISQDLLTLSRTASLTDLIESLESPETLEEKPGPVPPRANQIAQLILSKAIQLIRLGTQGELAEASVEALKALSGSQGRRLEEYFPDAHRLLSGAAIALRAATTPASAGGELPVLRGWNGKALRVIKLLEKEQGAVSRAALRDHLEMDESHLSHLLGAMEAAGLVVRTREGRAITVHLGPSSQSEHVRKFIESHIEPPKPPVQEVEAFFKSVLDPQSSISARHLLAVEGIESLLRQARWLKEGVNLTGIEVDNTVVTESEVVCRIRFLGRIQVGAEDGLDVDRYLVWVAVLEDDVVTKFETWSSLQGVPRPLASPGETRPLAGIGRLGPEEPTVRFDPPVPSAAIQQEVAGNDGRRHLPISVELQGFTSIEIGDLGRVREIVKHRAYTETPQDLPRPAPTD